MCEPHRCPCPNLRRQPARLAGSVEVLRFGIGERSNHWDDHKLYVYDRQVPLTRPASVRPQRACSKTLFIDRHFSGLFIFEEDQSLFLILCNVLSNDPSKVPSFYVFHSLFLPLLGPFFLFFYPTCNPYRWIFPRLCVMQNNNH